MSAVQDDQEHIHIDVLVCPLCGEANRCSYAAGHPHSECWCNRATFPEGVFDRIPPEQRRKSCICQRCLDDYADKRQPKEEPHS
uniref:cysteine-rich CWC family protein n=1 Tax=Paenibacillus sp. FSL K6-1122 TaxID=2954512 RepID=UPI00403F0304